MTSIEALEKLNALRAGGDTEEDHSVADEVLIAFLRGHDPACRDIAEAWLRARERVGFWYA